MSLPAALFVLFLALKLCGVIAWSWWWVTAPLWIPFIFFGVSLLIFTAIACAVTLIENASNGGHKR